MGNTEWDDERPLEDWEYPDADDESAEGTPTQSCPMCGIDLDEDALQCPLCGQHLTRPSSAWSGRPAWWIVLGVLGIAAVVLTLAIL
jgi:hypothetical protein